MERLAFGFVGSNRCQPVTFAKRRQNGSEGGKHVLIVVRCIAADRAAGTADELINQSINQSLQGQVLPERGCSLGAYALPHHSSSLNRGAQLLSKREHSQSASAHKARMRAGCLSKNIAHPRWRPMRAICVASIWRAYARSARMRLRLFTLEARDGNGLEIPG